MFGTSPFDPSSFGRGLDVRSALAVATLAREAMRRRKQSAVDLALTGELLSDTRELLSRIAATMAPPRRRRCPRPASARAVLPRRAADPFRPKK